MTDLERRLADLADHLDVPDSPDLAARVGARLRAEATVPRWWTRPRRVAVVAAAAIAGVMGATFAPALAEWLGVRGVEVRQEPSPVTVRGGGTGTAPPVETLDLGERVAFGEAAASAGFRLLVPAALGTPDSVWVDALPGTSVVSFVYDGGPLVSQFRASLATGPVLRKFTADPSVRVEELEIDGGRALWVEGTHEIAVRAGRDFVVDRFRMSDSALLVERGEITVRIETTLGRADAIRIARSLRPSAPPR